MATTYSPANIPLYRGIQIVWYILGILQTLLIVRFLLRLFGANPVADFTNFIYTLSAPFVSPFINVFPATVIDEGAVEWGTILAMLVYGLIAAGIVKLLAMSRPISSPEASERLNNE